MFSTLPRSLKVWSAALGALALTSLVGCGTEARALRDNAPRTIAVAPADTSQAYLQKLHFANQLEGKFALLAISKGSNQEVKDFADRMKADHDAADLKVMAMALKLGFTLVESDQAEPAIRDPFDKTFARLDALAGMDFDKAFLDVMVKDHDKLVTELKAPEEANAQQEVRVLIADLLPTIELHREHAKILYARFVPRCPEPNPESRCQ